MLLADPISPELCSDLEDSEKRLSRSGWRCTGPLRYDDIESRPGSSLAAEEPAKACEYGPFACPKSGVFPKPNISLDFFLTNKPGFRADLSRLEEVVGAVVIIVGAWVRLAGKEEDTEVWENSRGGIGGTGGISGSFRE